jgi:uncharacterized protein
MKRRIYKYLLNWKNSASRKPLIIRGARQVGKSYIAKELGAEFEYFVEVNFEKTPSLKKIFDGDLDSKTITNKLEILLDVKIIPEKTLLFFDEIQECPNAIKALRYFYEEIPKLHVLSAGSLLEFELNKQGVPVGRVEFLHLYPLCFLEYLEANGQEKAINILREHDYKKPLDQTYHENFLKHFKTYSLIGGMPEVVKSFVQNNKLDECLRIQSQIINSFRQDIVKYTKSNRVSHVQTAFEAMPNQIGKKLKYSNIDKNLRSSVLSEAIQTLVSAGVVYKIFKTSGNGLPLGAEAKLEHFKCLFLDLGLTQNMLGATLKDFINKDSADFINKGEVAEQIVGQELVAMQDPASPAAVFYWHREAKTSNAEIDYLIQNRSSILPIEVKAGSTGKLKSLHLFLEEKSIDKGFKISTDNFGINGKVISIPCYAIFKIIAL